MIEWHIIEEVNDTETFRKPYTNEKLADRMFELVGGLFISDVRYSVVHVGSKSNEAWCITGPNNQKMVFRLRRIVTI